MHSRCYRWGCIIHLAARAHRPLASCPLVRQVVMATLMARGEAERTRAVGTCFLLEHTIIHVRIFGNSAEQNRVETQIICGDLLMVPRVVSHCVASTATVLPLEIFLLPVGGGLLTSRAAFASAIAPITHHLLAPCST